MENMLDVHIKIQHSQKSAGGVTCTHQITN